MLKFVFEGQQRSLCDNLWRCEPSFPSTKELHALPLYQTVPHPLPKSLINLSLIFASAIRVFLRDFGTEVVTHAWRVQIMGRDFENNLRRHLCGQSCLHTHKHKHICAHVHMQHLGRIPTSNWNLFLCLPKLPPFTLAISILFYACLTQL